MPSPKRPRGEGQHLYLIFDDWPWGYSVREINLQPASPHKRTSPSQRNSPSSAARPRCLPRPFIQIEVPRGYPNFFAAVGTKILVTQCRNTWDESVPGGFLPIIDVRSRGVNFGPGEVYQDTPIFLPVGDELVISLDTLHVRALSLKQLWPPRQEHPSSGQISWSWLEFSCPPFEMFHITSYAVHPDQHAILVSTSSSQEEEEEVVTQLGTFALHTDKLAMVEGEKLSWTRLGEWSLPFAGRAHFVHCLDAFVGLSKDPATFGHLCSSSSFSLEDESPPPAWKVSKEKLFSDDPAETHVSATLVHMGGSEFCLVQCVSIGNGIDTTDLEELQHKDTNGEGDSIADHEQLEARRSYLYWLTTFSLSYDDNGDLTTGETCTMQCYKVPEDISKDYLSLSDPVAFWL